MTLAERHNTILELLKQRGSILVSDLAEILKVSSVTIRKDLTLLEEKKMLYRTHGSAILINPYINDRNVSEKEKLNPEEKQAIGKAAASLIIPDDSIIIASGTTMFFLAREIRPSDHLTVITSSINVTSILARQHNIDIIQLGGLVRNSSVSVVSEYAVKMLENFSCSKLFIGVDGIDPNYGLTTTNLLEASLNRAMIQAAQKTIVLTDSSKFGRRGFGKICGLEAIDQIITDDKVSPLIVKDLEERGIEITIAPQLHKTQDSISLIPQHFDLTLFISS